MNTTDNEVYEIDLLEILAALRKRLWLLILCTLIGGGAAAGYVFFLATPIYQSTAKLYIKTQTTSITSLADIQMGSQLAHDYEEMVKSRPFLNELIQNLQLGYSYKYIASNMVTVENPDNTRILCISVKSSDTEEAKAMANELAMISKRNIANIMATDEPVLYERAIASTRPISPNKKKVIALGLILGLMFAVFIVSLQTILNDKIKDIEEIERYLSLPVLATIPHNEQSTNKKKEIVKSTSKRERKK